MLWSLLASPWHAAIAEAWRAYCAGSIAIGAVITAPDGHIIATGYNQVVSAAGTYHPLNHAELSALTAFDYGRYDPPFDYALYTTLEPCPLCLGAFYMSGLRELHYAARDPYAGSTNLLGTTPYLQRKPIRLFHPPNVVLEVLLSAIIIAPLLAGGATVGHPLLSAYQQQLPVAYQFGNQLAKSGQLEVLRRQGTSAHTLLDQLEMFYVNL